MAETQRVLAREPAEVQMSIRTTLRKKNIIDHFENKGEISRLKSKFYF